MNKTNSITFCWFPMIKLGTLLSLLFCFSLASNSEDVNLNKKPENKNNAKERLILKPIANKVVEPTIQTRVMKPFSVEYKKRSHFSE